MKLKLLRSVLALCLLAAANAHATVLYVDVNNASPAPPFANWITAATNIQDAVDAATTGDQILVTNGVYQTGGRIATGATGTNRVAIDKRVLVQSVNGPQFTVIQGVQIGSGAIRCAYLATGASLSGFTLTNGAGQLGGGINCQSASAVVSNCVLTGNSADQGAGAYHGTLNNCTLRQNVTWAGGSGGGALGATLNNCMVISNSAYSYGGGVASSKLNNCTLIGNLSRGDSGGADASSLTNCLLEGNSAWNFGGGDGYGILKNCTLVDNSAGNGGGTYHGTLRNCVVYSNTALQGANSTASSMLYCCTTPKPPGGTGNFTNAPFFVDQAGGNLRLQSNSPCINSGLNAPASTGPDLDGNPRVAGGTVDVGAYEFQSPVSMISYAWLQQYNLIPDASVDSADSDNDGHGNWQEWIAGTIPTDSTSLLRLLPPTTEAAGVTVIWQSVSNRTYFLERATNLEAAPPFSLLTSNLAGQAGATAYMDTNAIGDGPFFYRVGVQQ